MSSENGWEPARATAAQCEWVTVPGTRVSLQILKGQPLAILRAAAADFSDYVEPLRDADSASYTPTNSVATSNHLNGTACDWNWNTHPFKVKGTFTADQMTTIREMLDWYEGTLFWAGDWANPIDEMHWQLGYGSYNNPKTADFIGRKIRPDGFSTFRRDTTPPTQGADVIAQATGVSVSKAAEIQAGIVNGLRDSEAVNTNRVAMWLAQMGHESAGFNATEEYASGAAYEGRKDLGNIFTGDGVRFKGRSWIQVTGRNNYAQLSAWAHSKNIVPTATYFVDHPEKLAEIRYAGLGPAWYWTVARPQINELSDARDIVAVTRAINGGTNGLADRKARYDRALRLGDQLLTLVTTEADLPGGFMSALSPQEQRQLYDEIMSQRRSRSPLRHVGETFAGDLADMTYNTDGSVHIMVVYLSAVILGDPDAIRLLHEVAGVNTVRYPDRVHDSRLARAMLNLIDGKTSAVSAPATGGTTGVVPSYAPPAPVVAPQVPQPSLPAVVAQQGVRTPTAEGGLLGEITALTTQLQTVSRQVTEITEGAP